MSILKSNSALIAFDNSSLSNPNEFSFLNYVQSFSLNNTSNRLNQKYLGSSTLNKTQFVQPEVDLSIKYIQKNDFFNEKLFGFNIILNDQEYTSIAKILHLIISLIKMPLYYLTMSCTKMLPINYLMEILIQICYQ